ncbi:MAG: DUF4912 domain-containing protein [Microcoleaceae cyanobacterium]
MLPNKTASTFALALLTWAALSGSLSKSVASFDVQLAQAPESAPAFQLPAEVPQGTAVRVDGDSSMAIINKALKQRFEQEYPGTNVTIAAQGSEAALQALQDGKLDLVAIGRPLTDSEKSAGLVEVPLSREKIAIIVGKDNPFNGNISFREFAGIFRGEITDWSEVGGEPGAIYFVDRPQSSNTRQSFQTYEVFQAAGFETGASAVPVTEDSTDAVIKALQRDGISYAIAGQVQNRDDVKIISMHKTLPDDPRYPFSQPRGYVYSKNNLTPPLEAFLGFSTSPLGAKVVAEAKLAESEGREPNVADIPSENPPVPVTQTPEATVAAPVPEPIEPQAATTQTTTTTTQSERGIKGFWWWLLPLGLLGGAWWLRGRREDEERRIRQSRPIPEPLPIPPSSNVLPMAMPPISTVDVPDLPTSAQIVAPVLEPDLEPEELRVETMVPSVVEIQELEAEVVVAPNLDTLPVPEGDEPDVQFVNVPDQGALSSVNLIEIPEEITPIAAERDEGPEVVRSEETQTDTILPLVVGGLGVAGVVLTSLEVPASDPYADEEIGGVDATEPEDIANFEEVPSPWNSGSASESPRLITTESLTEDLIAQNLIESAAPVIEAQSQDPNLGLEGVLLSDEIIQSVEVEAVEPRTPRLVAPDLDDYLAENFVLQPEPTVIAVEVEEISGTEGFESRIAAGIAEPTIAEGILVEGILVEETTTEEITLGGATLISVVDALVTETGIELESTVIAPEVEAAFIEGSIEGSIEEVTVEEVIIVEVAEETITEEITSGGARLISVVDTPVVDTPVINTSVSEAITEPEEPITSPEIEGVVLDEDPLVVGRVEEEPSADPLITSFSIEPSTEPTDSFEPEPLSAPHQTGLGIAAVSIQSPAQPAETTLPRTVEGGILEERVDLADTESQSRIEATKFDIGQAEETESIETVDQNLPGLPEGYGKSKIVLLPRDPNSAYAYWDIPNEDREIVRQQGGRQLALRLYDVTSIDMDDQTPHSVQQFECEEMTREWYIPVLVSDRDYIVEIGYMTESGHWLKLARSLHVHIPPLYPSDSYDYRDITVSWEEALRGKFFFNLGEQHSFPQVESSLPLRSLADLGLMSSAGFASAPPARPTQFWLVANAELIIHGATEPDAQVSLGEVPIQLEPDGTFRLQMPFEDGLIDSPIFAIAPDEEQTRFIHLQFLRETPEQHTNSEDNARDH